MLLSAGSSPRLCFSSADASLSWIFSVDVYIGWSTSVSLFPKVVGDKKCSTFCGLIEAPLQPTNIRKYQGKNNINVMSSQRRTSNSNQL